jgi:hypothetical protein
MSFINNDLLTRISKPPFLHFGQIGFGGLCCIEILNDWSGAS